MKSNKIMSGPKLSVVAGRDEEVGHLCQLILSEGQFVLTPVVLVSSLPALDTLLDGGCKELESDDKRGESSLPGIGCLSCRNLPR